MTCLSKAKSNKYCTCYYHLEEKRMSLGSRPSQIQQRPAGGEVSGTELARAGGTLCTVHLADQAYPGMTVCGLPNGDDSEANGSPAERRLCRYCFEQNDHNQGLLDQIPSFA